MMNYKFGFYWLILVLPMQLISQDTKADKKNFAVSVFTGAHLMQADIKGQGLGYGLGVKFFTNSAISFNVNLYNLNAKGISAQRWTHSIFGGGLVEPVFEQYRNSSSGWFPSFKSNILVTDLDINLNIAKILSKLFDVNTPKYDVFVSTGTGLFIYNTTLDLLNAQDATYSQAYIDAGIFNFDPDISSDRNAIVKALNDVHDGKYETEAYRNAKVLSTSFGGSFRWHLNNKIGIGLGYKQLRYLDFDYHDGIKFRTALDQTDDNDRSHLVYVLIDYMF